MASVVSRTVEQESSYAAVGARAAPGAAPVRLQRHVRIGIDVERRDFTSVEFTAGDLRDHGGVVGARRKRWHRYADALAPELLDHHLAQMRISRDAAADAVFLASGGMQGVFGLLVLNVKDGQFCTRLLSDLKGQRFCTCRSRRF